MVNSSFLHQKGKQSNPFSYQSNFTRLSSLAYQLQKFPEDLTRLICDDYIK